MATENKCPHCGKLVPATALAGICPKCMLKAGLTETGEIGPGGTLVTKPPPQPAPRVEEIAPHFPQLEILECLGRGGMGAVYKARQPKLDRFVALKILTRAHDSKISDMEFAARFQQEARALARLNHPDIVAVYDFGEAGGFHYLLMEYVDGLTLRQLLQTKKISPEEALAIVPKICEALQFAHERGIVHRDIKPENILLDKQGRVKIADFGIAKILGADAAAGNLTGAKDVIGTPHYMAPEQIEKPTKVDHRADIYSLGVVFYEMLTGELPLGNFQRPSRKVQVDVRLDEVVLHALENEPDRRYQHASEVKTDLETIAATPESKSAIRISQSGFEQSLLTSDATGRWVSAARWTARVLGTLLLLFYGVFIVAEGLPPIASQPEGVQLNFAALGLMLAGFVIGWKREGAAALFIAVGWTVWHISEARMRWNIFQTPLPVAALYAYCWWATRGRHTGRLALTSIALAVILGMGQLFLPTSVFVRGAVVDAQTGRPVPNAEVRLLPRSLSTLEKGDRPNARGDQNGRFTLYLGWYAEGKQVAVSAVGYEPLTTNFGPRELGQRNLSRDFPLQRMASRAVSPQVPPVVVSTIPASGATGVDPALTELRVTFSKPMRDGGWSWTTWGEENFPETTGQPCFLTDGRTCVLPVKLKPGKLYATWLNSDYHKSFTDMDGQPAVPYLLIFQTRNEP